MNQAFEWRDAPDGHFAVVGDPVGHSLSPRMHTAAYTALGSDLVYRAIRVPFGEFTEAVEHLRSFGYIGLNVTVPHKESAFEWCEGVEGGAWRYGAVNTLRLADRVGINTDVAGFMSVLGAHGVQSPKRVLFLGSGGSARALMASSCDAGFEVAAWNRTRSKLEAMVAELAIKVEVLDEPVIAGCAAVVNATSASLGGIDLPVDWSEAGDDCFAFDLAYADELTPFLRRAHGRGLAVSDGLPMLVEQGALAFEWWTGKVAPREAMLRSVGL